ncbi:MAG: starch-binding protein [Clostridiales bacterium]|nr:starch-binding protein [Clostridiales bacterium]
MKRRLSIFILIAVISTFTAGFCACAGDDRDENTLPPIVDNTGGDTDNTGGDTDNTGGDTDNTGGDTDNTGGDTDNTGDDDNSGNGGSGNGNNTTTPTTDTRTPTSNAMKNTKTTVYYNSKWNRVYAYLWNSKTPSSPKKAWPGDLLTANGSNEYGEKQYSVSVDYSVYNRIIFTDNNGNQTKDLVVSSAVSGYYGTDGVFTEGTDDYGKVTEKTFTDAKNLAYIGNKSKKVWVYTPPNYSPKKKYGVLYMFDGQNAFGAVKDNSNAWFVDVAITNLVKNGGDGVIVVGIDNGSGGSDQRDQELTMSPSFGTLTELGARKYGYFTNGKLDELGNFIKETVMPWVSKNYSVDSSREKTGIVGSSSGGLGSYYLGLRDNDLYGYIGAFSPANGLFTTSDWTKFYKSKNFGSANKPKIYVYCGKNDHDLEDMLLPETQRIKNLTSYGFKSADIIENYVDGGTHNETYWRVAFAEFAGKLIP